MRVWDRGEPRVAPRLLAGAAGITDQPLTEMGKAGRGAALNLWRYYLCVLGGMQTSGV